MGHPEPELTANTPNRLVVVVTEKDLLLDFLFSPLYNFTFRERGRGQFQMLDDPALDTHIAREANKAHVRDCQNHITARRFEYLHDLRLVCPPQESQRSKMVRRRGRELGDRSVRISVAGSGKSHWSLATDYRATESNPGSDY